ncbi:hypothetical protein [Xanthomonas translucens]|nr:hypothetical protein [Xanthomonas translucens]AVY67196.1 hypothetical protein NZ30_12970 [Xanthomonas translucens pv. undulosa]MCT8281796.1 hypothetical protein [Xanthomonas translucens pv. undulosa]MCT8316450.1 hypothetical protein [Xanthomonas translucens pv. undulosa]UKE38308.1 hypothetical protein KCU58_11080 [Xanthomonas translucens pv. undulosa]
MRAFALLRLLACSIAAGFLSDMLRRCFVIEAWTLVPFVAAALALALIATRWSWRAARRPRLPADFVRPNTPDFPEQPRRGVR